MIKYFDSIDMAVIGNSFVKKDLFYKLVKKYNIDIKKVYVIGIDDKLGVLKITNELKTKGFKAKSFWINRADYPRYNSKLYDYEIKSLKDVIKFIETKKISNLLIIADFDNTLAKANYEATKRTTKEINIWDKMPKNFLTKLLVMLLAPFTYLTILIDLFKPSSAKYEESKIFKKYLTKKKINMWVISYRSKILQKKYF